ncbi:MAG: glucosyltransferase domain-containing protein [Clostridiales bacterium]|nr:glucosyltransferase domain-containing protein [Clostridiales bacterium]
MKCELTTDIKDYGKTYGKLILLSFVFSVLCFGVLALSDNIRIDTEELLNAPGSTLGWLTIGRYSLVFFKGLLGLGTHSAQKSGVLFLLFFILGANFLTFLLYHFSRKNERYPYWAFLLLYCTSNIWSYQIYFSLQQAEIALAMLLLVAAAFFSMRAAFVLQGYRRLLPMAVASVFLVLGLGAYQALATYYIAICLAVFLIILDEKRNVMQLIRGIVLILVHFLISYLLYNGIASTWFMATGEYMQSQMGWGRMPIADCIKSVLRTGRNVVLGYGPRNFSFYTAGVLLCASAIFLKWKRGGFFSKAQLMLLLLGFVGLLFSPFLMTLYMGEMLVTRSQFALPVAAAFFGMYGMKSLREELQKPWNGIKMAAIVCVFLTAVIQSGYNLRLAYTDGVRYRQDAALTDRLMTELKKENGGVLPDVPVLFVGYRMPEYDALCARTEMYGWSFYEWDYSEENPTGATHRIVGFVKAYSGISLQEGATEQMREEAVRRAADMPDFPAQGSVQKNEDFVIVRLSEVRERTDLNWW